MTEPTVAHRLTRFDGFASTSRWLRRRPRCADPAVVTRRRGEDETAIGDERRLVLAQLLAWGFGLPLVEALAARWGTRIDPTAKTVGSSHDIPGDQPSLGPR
jgi:hypothetical protein